MNVKVLLWAFATVLLVAPLGVAQSDPQALVARMVQHELSSQKTQNYWMYTDNNASGETDKVTRVVETPDCWFQWLLSVNGHPASPSQQQQERAKIEHLVNDPSARQADRKQIDQDGQKAEALVRQLPRIFLYTDDGQQDGNIRLKFRPNPTYKPPTREAKVFHNMDGVLLIDQKETRLAGISGTLMSDVSFGLGVLGKLHKGGTFKVVQSQLAPQDWEVTLLDVHIHGKALFFKTISEDQHEVKSAFQAIPSDVGLQAAASLAEHGRSSTKTVAAY